MQKTQLPLTTNVLFQTKKNTIEVIATDLENTIQTTLFGKVLEEGGVLLPIKPLTEIVSMLPKDQISLEEENLVVKIKTPKNEIKINGVSKNEFPKPPNIDKKNLLPIKDLLTYIKKVAFAASADESRAVITGVLLRVLPKETLIVATDGYRLSLKKLGKGNVGEMQVIVSARILIEVAKLISEKKDGEEEKEEVLLAVSGLKNQVAFLFSETTIFARLIEGEFPTFEKIIPQSFTTKAVFDKEIFLKAVRLSSVFARESANIVRMKLGKEGLTLSANATQIGENVSEVEASFEGDENEIAFNSRFLLEFLNNVDTKELAFEMTGPLNPGVFKIPGDDSYLHIIMPVRVQGEQ